MYVLWRLPCDVELIPNVFRFMLTADDGGDGDGGDGEFGEEEEDAVQWSTQWSFTRRVLVTWDVEFNGVDVLFVVCVVILSVFLFILSSYYISVRHR